MIRTLTQMRVGVLLQGTAMTIEDLADAYEQQYGEKIGDPKRELLRMEQLGMVRRGYTEYAAHGRKGRLRSEFCMTVRMRLALGRELQIALDRRLIGA